MGGKETQIRADNGPIKGNSGPQSGGLRALSSEELARRSQEGCRASFAELADRYGVRLLRFLRRRTNNAYDAEDLVQDTFVRAYANIGRYRSSYKFSTWLFTIAKRLASSHLRRQRCSKKTILEARTGGPTPGEEAAQRETRQGLWETAGTLSANQYQTLWLRYAEEMPIREIAKVMSKSQVSVKVTLYRARMRLAERLRNMAAKGKAGRNVSSKETPAFMKVEGA